MAENHIGIKENSKNKSKLSSELAIKIIDGDLIARNDFVKINYNWLLFIVRAKFSSSNNHEDIVQDTFMLVINKLQQGAVKNPITILAFLRTSAINIGFEYLRKDKKFVSAIDQEMMTIIADAKEDVLSTLIWDDKIKYIKEVINELNIQRDKDILTQFYFEDLCKVDICSTLQLSTEHFDRVLYRAKERLKQLISQKEGGPKGKLNAVSSNQKPNKESHNFMSKIFESIKHTSGIFLWSFLKYGHATKQGDFK